MECVMIKDLQEDIPNFKEIEARKKRNLISCFHVGNKETLAFWDTYAKTDTERRKFALRFDRVELISRIESAESIEILEKSVPNIKSIVHGKVIYKNLIGTKKENLSKKKVLYPAFRKEYAFAYEREYRFVISLKKGSSSLGFGLNIGKLEDIDFSILVNPLLETDDYINCIKTIKESKFGTHLNMSVLTKWIKPELWK